MSGDERTRDAGASAEPEAGVRDETSVPAPARASAQQADPIAAPAARDPTARASDVAPPAHALREYRQVVARVDAFGEAIGSRRAADLRCGAGCDGCCRVELAVAPVEAAAVQAALDALPADRRQALRLRAQAGQEDEASGGERCAMLDDDGRCAIYEARPLVCRTQGLALRYPAGFVPAEAVGLDLGERGVATWCPLNFTERPPEAADVLDAERIDALLAVVNQRFVAAEGADPLERHRLRDLAAAG